MSDPVALLLVAILAPVAAGAVTLLLPTRVQLLRVLIACCGPAASLVCLGRFLSSHGLAAGRVSWPWMPALDLDLAFNLDPLGGFFALLVAGFGLLILLYGRAYLGPDGPALAKFYPLIGGFMSAMLGLVLADDFLLMLLFWEATSVTSFLLIGWDHTNKTAVKNALQAFLTTGFGGLALLGGLVWLGVLTGAGSFTELGPVAASGPMVGAFLLIYVGIAAKSAQWPLHYWLPGAMLAPTPISAYLHSAAMVKAGVYLLARTWPTLGALELWPIIVAGIGGVTMLLGAFVALQRDVLKQILAYTTISQLGLLAAAFGLAHFAYNDEPNLIWGNAQILNHALYKAPLFMLAGATAHALGKADLSRLRGAIHAKGERLYAVLFLLALGALAALPGTFSFFAKEAFLYQIWHAIEETHAWPLYVLGVAAVLTSVFNVAILVRFAQTFLSRPIPPGQTRAELAHDDEAHAHHDEHPHDSFFWTAMLWLPAALLIATQYFGGVAGPFASELFSPLESVKGYFAKPEYFSLIYVLTHPTVPLLASGIGIVLGVLLGLSPLLRGYRGDWHDHIFPNAYAGIIGGGNFAFGSIQTGRMRWYVLATCLMLAGVVGWVGYAAYRLDALALPPEALVVPGFLAAPQAWLLCGLVSLAATIMVFVRDRAARVLVLGTVGFGVAGLFYAYAAPDLALTQLSVEIVSLILFLLVLNLLPEKSEGDRTLVALRVPAALVVGTMAFAVTLWAGAGPRPERAAILADGTAPATLGDYFLRNSYKGFDTAGVPADALGDGVVDRGEKHLKSFGSGKYESDKETYAEGLAVHKGGGGANVVNVILVDFRGFDTLGEIAVLGLAAMGVWTLLRKPPTRLDRLGTDNRSLPFDDTFVREATAGAFGPVASAGPRADHPVRSELIATPILRTAARLLIPLAIVFALYLFFKGHQSPGGGFVAGLASAVALLVYRMCFGCDALYRFLPVRERTLIAVGLLLAGAAAVFPLLLGLPLLTSNNGFLPLPGGGTFHWATVLVFDAGVYLVVVGSVVGMIDAITRELE